MSIRASLRATPALLRVGLVSSLAYRAELLVWILATTMPLVMMALFATVAREAPIGRFGEREVIAYFLATFLVRQLTGSWAAWEINFDVRQGTLANRLLKPIHPLWAYAMEGIAALPLRLALAGPIAIAALVITSRGYLPRDPVLWVYFALATAGGWAITYLINAALGSLALFMESSLKMVDVYLLLFFVASGYLVPVEIFPARFRTVIDAMPFRYQIGLPVEILVSVHDRATALRFLLQQWAWVAVLLIVTIAVFRRGMRRFGAFGG
jgi:ABC-2 type transport system permease protein